jgi:hypothetical protein
LRVQLPIATSSRLKSLLESQFSTTWTHTSTSRGGGVSM